MERTFGHSPEAIQILEAPFEVYQYEFIRGFLYVQKQSIHERICQVDASYEWVDVVTTRTGKNGRAVTAQGTLIVNGVRRVGVGYSGVDYTKKQASQNAAETEAKRQLLEAAIKEGVPVDQETLDELDRDSETTNGEANEGEKAAITDAEKRAAAGHGIGLHIRETYKTVTNHFELYEWLEARKRGDWTKGVFAAKCLKDFNMVPTQIGAILKQLGYTPDDGIPYTIKYRAILAKQYIPADPIKKLA